MTVQDRTPDRLGPYRLLERLGEGGMGIVYLARDPGERMVAVKALRPGVAAEATARRRLTREVETMRRVNSRFVAEVIDADVTSDPPYIVTRYVPGRTLDDVVGESGPLGGDALARLARGLADALAAVHAAGVVHRDLKPGNVMLVDGEPVVIDFGIAQLPETTRITMTGMFMGTPGYLAPEVIEGKQSGPASDVHSWGATVAYAATGRAPFGTGTFETIFYRIVHGQPDLGSIPSPLLPMVARALARDPARRPAAGELCEWAATLDPSSLVPGAAAAIAAPPGALPPAPGTLADRLAPAAPAGSPVLRREITRPLAVAGAGGAAGAGVAGGAVRGARAAGAAGDAAGAGGFGDGFRDLLPPVRYGQVPAPAGGQPGSPASAAGRAAAGQAGRRMPGTAQSARSPQVIAAMTAAVAAAVAFPLVGTTAALVGLIMLRVGDLTGHRLARRRSRQGSRTGDLLVAGAYFPLALCRSAIRFTLLAPLGLLWVGIAAAITIIVLPSHPLPRAFSYGAGALIAFYAIGPGSGGCRKPLGRLLGVARTPAAAIITFAAIAALALVAVALAVSQPPFYWPASHLSTQLAHQPALHSVISDMRRSLVRLAAHFGL